MKLCIKPKSFVLLALLMSFASTAAGADTGTGDLTNFPPEFPPVDGHPIIPRFKLGTAFQSSLGSGGNALLIEVGASILKTPDPGDPDAYMGTEDSTLIIAQLDSQITVPTDPLSAQMPYLDIHFIPIGTRIRFEDGKVTAIDDDGTSASAAGFLLPTDIGRDLPISQLYHVRVAAIGGQGDVQAVLSDRIKLFARAALTLLGYKGIGYDGASGLAPFNGVHLGGLDAEAGLRIAVAKGFIARISLGGSADINWGAADLTRFQSDQRGYAQLAAEISDFLLVYARAGIRGAWDSSTSSYFGAPEMTFGVSFLF